jgi:hypothetical protein
MMLLYGGEQPSGMGSFSDIWHIRVHLKEGNQHVHYSPGKLKGDHEHYIFSWRHGFSMHYLKEMSDPVIIGGTFGNGQTTNMMMLLPEKKCASVEEFEAGSCSMCSVGKVVSGLGECAPCQLDQRFDEDFDNYFKSSCKYCPLGTVGGQGSECIPCPASYIYNQGSCKKCDKDHICPIGTKYEFNKEKL